MTKPKYQDIADVDLRALGTGWYWVCKRTGRRKIVHAEKAFRAALAGYTHIAGPIEPPDMPNRESVHG